MLNLPSHRPARLPAEHPPVLTVVVDTEEEFDWSAPFNRNSVAVTSIAAQPMAHERVFDRYGLVPTYVVDWPVATTPEAYAVLKALQDQGRCEIGTHLHPWVSPPHTEEVNTFNSYAGNLPHELEFEKLQRLTTAITQNFGKAPRVFKAGRYGVGPHTASAIAQLGYTTDASVVPFTALTADGGPDFSQHGADPFWFEAEGQTLLEMPATAGYAGLLHQQGRGVYTQLQKPWMRSLRAPGIASKLGLLERIKLTPEGYTLDELKRVTRALLAQGTQCLGLTYHSPSLVPGHTSYVRTPAELHTFLNTLDGYLRFFTEEVGGQLASASQLRSLVL